jgi:hypothetical protein
VLEGEVEEIMARFPLLFASVLALPLLAATTSHAQDAAAKQYVDIAIKEPPKQDGLEYSLKNAVTISIVDSRDVIGVQPNGATYAFGLKFDGNATYRKGFHEWRTIGSVNEIVARTPAFPQIIKSADAATLDSTYLYFVKPWFGPFARFSAATPLFGGYDVRAAPTTYEVTKADGTIDNATGYKNTKRINLTDPFRPLTMKETIGPFARPITSEKINIEARVGLGGLQTLADGQLLIKDNPDTADKVEVITLSDVLQVGAEGSLETWGALYAKKITYKAGIGVLVPAWSNEKDVSPVKFTSLDIGAAVSFKIVEWASLDYELKVIRQPQLADVWQIRNGFLLTLGLGVEKKQKKAEPPAK